MPPLDFPSSPTNGQYYNGFVYNAANETWDSAYAPRPATIPITSPNYIINGAFDIWQRGTSFSSASLFTYSADRWFANSFTTSVATVTRQSFTPGDCPGGNETEFFLRFARTGTAPSGTSYLQHRIEDVRKAAGKTVTLSFYAKAATAGTINVNYNQNFGSGGSSTVYGAGQDFAVTTTWTRFQVSWTIPAISGKTVGSSSYVELLFSIPQAFGLNTLDIWGVQLEEGAAATDFRRNAPSIQAELAACQRYYWRITAQNTWDWFSNGQVYSSVLLIFPIQFPVTMRTVPSSTLEWSGSLSGFIARSGASTLTLTSTPVVASDSDGKPSPNMIQMYWYVTGAGANAGASARLMSNNNGSYIGFSAEL